MKKLFRSRTVACLGALAVVPALLATIHGCREAQEAQQPPGINTRWSMVEVQQSATQLLRFVWNPAEFADEKNRPLILSLMDELIGRFHRVDQLSSRFAVDPSFTIILENQHDILREIRSQFAAWQVEPARQRFRSLNGNCIACHSRYAVPHDFMGEEPPVTSNSLGDRFAAAEYLFATRQFDKADAALLSLTTNMSSVPFATVFAMKAVKLWLVIEVRIKERPELAATTLKDLLPKMDLEPHDKALVKEWIVELREISRPEAASGDGIEKAKYWLGKGIAERSPKDDERSLPKTLFATSILHKTLAGSLSAPDRLQALYLLALAYNHLPVGYLSASRDEYLAAVILEFPKTPEAAQAFRMYEEAQLAIHGKNEAGQAALTEMGKQRLEHLRRLANP